MKADLIRLKKVGTDKHRLKDSNTVIVRSLRLKLDSSATRSITSILLKHLKMVEDITFGRDSSKLFGFGPAPFEHIFWSSSVKNVFCLGYFSVEHICFSRARSKHTEFLSRRSKHTVFWSRLSKHTNFQHLGPGTSSQTVWFEKFSDQPVNVVIVSLVKNESEKLISE